jgi:hypothetical protein
MPNPTPIYVVTYDGLQLPGYVQNEDRPVVMASIEDTILGREGINSTSIGSKSRQISFTFLVKSELENVSDLLHLENCKDQWRSALKILTRNPGMKELKIKDTDRYYLAKTERSSQPLAAGKSRSIMYTVDFTAQPWAYAETPATDTFTGNGGILLDVGDSRKTYPVFTIPSGVTAFTATDDSGSGKSLDFVRGSYGSVQITIDCAQMLVYRTSTGVDASSTMANLNFGLYYNGTDGNYNITITNFAGSGTVTVDAYPRYEL